MNIARTGALIISCCIMLILCIALPSDGYRGIVVIDDLKHGSGKVGTFRALIIAINDYKDPKIPDLDTPLNDARALADLLKKKYGFTVDTIKGKKATRKGLYNALRNLSSKAKPEDSVLIYYAGHGDIDRQYNDGWWIPYDATAGDPVTYLDNVQVQKAMRSMKARHVLLISDSCYSGTLFGQARAMPPVIDNKYYLSLYNEKSRWGMTSGNKTPVADDGTEGHSIFAYQLIKELRRNDKPYLSTQEIYTRIAPIVSNNSEQVPLCRPIRNTGDQGGEFVFIASSSATFETVSPEIKKKAALSVESNVEGVRVFVDGRPIGYTPLSSFDVSTGEHHILAEKQGYETYQKRVRFEHGRTMSMYVDLSKVGPAPARLYIETEPADAEVRILNIDLRFYQGINLEPGKYRVEVSAEGYETEKQWVTLGTGEDKYLDISLHEKVMAFSNSQIKLAVFPWKLIGSAESWNFLTLQALDEIIKGTKVFVPVYSYYDLGEGYDTKTYDKKTISDHVTENLWIKKGNYTSNELNLGYFWELANEINVDAILLGHFHVKPWDPDKGGGKIYLINVRTKTIYQSKYYTTDYDSEGFSLCLKSMKKVFNSYLQD